MANLYYLFKTSLAGYGNVGDVKLLAETAQLDQIVANGWAVVVSGPATNPNSVVGGTLSAGQANTGMTERAMRRFHYALGQRNIAGAGAVKGGCDVLFAGGDSLIQGIGVSLWANRLDQQFANMMRTEFPQAAVGGIGLVGSAPQGSNFGATFSDSPVTGTFGGVLTPVGFVPGYGLDSATSYMTASGQKRIFSFTGTDFDVCLFATQTGAATCNVLVDGVNYGTYNAGTGVLTAGAGTWGTTVSANNTLAHVKIRGLAAGAHVISINWASGVFYVNNAFCYNGDVASGVRVAAAGWSGRGTVNYVGLVDGGAVAGNPYAPGYQAEQWLQNIADGTYLPDLVFMDNYANDYAGTSHDIIPVPTNFANHMSIIAKIKAAVVTGCGVRGITPFIPSFVEMPCHCVFTSNIGGLSGSGGTMVDLWGNYAANAYAVAQADPDGAVAVFDLGQRLQGSSNVWDNVTYQGLLDSHDNVHPSDAGTQWWARSLVDFVRPK